MFMHNGRNRIAAKQRPKSSRKARALQTAVDHPSTPMTQAKTGKRAKRREAARAKSRTTPAVADQPLMMLVPSFPTGLVAPKPLGVAITSVAVPPKPLVTILPKAEKRKPRAQPKLPAKVAKVDLSPPVITLPKRDEPLVAQAKPETALPDDRSYFTMPETALPRDRSLTKPSVGLVGAIGAWLQSMGKLMASGFMVKKRRPTAPPVPVAKRGFTMPQSRSAPEASMRERTEMTQLRAENRRLRSQLEAIEALRSAPGSIPRWNPASRAKVDSE